MSPSLVVMLAEVAAAGMAPAAGELPNVILTWQSPPGCPDTDDVKARLQRLLRDSSVSTRERPLAVHGRVHALDSTGFLLELTTTQGEEQFARSLQASTCEGITEAGALVIALAIDPELAVRTPDAQSASVELEPPPASMPPAIAPRFEPSASPRTAAAPVGRTRDVRFGLAAGVLADTGTLPGLGYGPTLAFFATSGRFSVELTGLGLLPRTGLVPGQTAEGGQISLVAGELRGCGRLGRLALDIHGCAVLEVGSTHAESFGADVGGSSNDLWFAPGAAFVGVQRLRGDISWRLQVAGLFPTRRAEFTIENAGPVHQASAVVLRAGLGIEAIF